MEVAASLVGLLAVGAKIGMTLHEFVSNCADAPTIAQTISDEIRDFRFALSKLQPYVRKNNPSQMTLLGASMTDVNHLSLTISSCIVTFGRLEKIVDKLKPGNQMDTLTRLKWSWSETAISQLVQRLQQHKITLTLLLTIWLSESCSEVEQCTDQLNDQLTEMIQPRDQILDALPTETQTLAVPTDPSSASIFTISGGSLRSFRRNFESTLYSSRPYRHITAGSMISLSSSQHPAPRWSLVSGRSSDSVFSLPVTGFSLSGVSIKEIPDIARIPLPMSFDNIYNHWWYVVSPALHNQPRPALPGVGGGALLFAAENGHWGTVFKLLSIGADIRSRGGKSETIIHIAVTKDATGILDILLDRGADIEARNDDGDTPLHHACRLGSENAVRVLLDRGANLEAKTFQDRSPLHSAVAGASLNLSQNRERPSGRAESGGWPEIVQLLLGHGSDVHVMDATGMTALHNACWQSHVETARLLLGAGAEVDQRTIDGRTALHVFLSSPHSAGPTGATTAQLLLKHGASLEAKTSDGKAALHVFLSHQHSAERGGATIVQLLLKYGAPLEAITNDGRPALHVFLNNPHSVGTTGATIIQLLLEHGASLEAKNTAGGTALHVFLSNPHSTGSRGATIIQLLLEHGAPLEADAIGGESPLYYFLSRWHSTSQGGDSTVRLLLSHGASLEARTSDGETPLHAFLRNPHHGGYVSDTVLRMLLRHGASLEAKTNRGHTALDLANCDRYRDIIKEIRNRALGNGV